MVPPQSTRITGKLIKCKLLYNCINKSTVKNGLTLKLWKMKTRKKEFGIMAMTVISISHKLHYAN